MGERVGRVVLSIDTDEYAPDYSRKDWAELLKEGVLILFADIGLVHCLGQDEDLHLIARASGSSDG